jgi:flagellar biosynthesis/type III secretory pathway protein FliH
MSLLKKSEGEYERGYQRGFQDGYVRGRVSAQGDELEQMSKESLPSRLAKASESVVVQASDKKLIEMGAEIGQKVRVLRDYAKQPVGIIDLKEEDLP